MIRIDQGKYIMEQSDLTNLLEEAVLTALETYEAKKKSKYTYTPEGCISRQDLIKKIGFNRVEKLSRSGVITKIKNGKHNSKVFFSLKELELKGITVKA
jgi:hypothetical protein